MYWDDFSRYYDWEFNMICTEQCKDVEMWLQLASEYGDPILEIGCGSGRITIPLIEKGYQVTALDFSAKMLELLQEKAGNNEYLQMVQADMTNFQLNRQFPFVFVSYSSFQQLLTLKDQVNCLNTIYNHLEAGGVLAMDICPCVCEGPDEYPLSRQYTSDYPEKNTNVSMYSSYQVDRLNLIKHWTDKYIETDATGNKREMINKISLKECNPDYMKILLEKCGFKLEHIWGDFRKGKVTAESYNTIYIARKS